MFYNLFGCMQACILHVLSVCLTGVFTFYRKIFSLSIDDIIVTPEEIQKQSRTPFGHSDTEITLINCGKSYIKKNEIEQRCTTRTSCSSSGSFSKHQILTTERNELKQNQQNRIQKFDLIFTKKHTKTQTGGCLSFDQTRYFQQKAAVKTMRCPLTKMMSKKSSIVL